MKPVEARKLKGFQDFLPAQAEARQRIKDTIRKYAARAGFLPIDTPVLEYADVLVGSGGGDTEKETYLFKDHGDRLVGLRFDLTVPFARFTSENFALLQFPFKRLQIGEVWRGEKPQKGRYRQFCQADLDIVGVDSMAADVEVVSTLVDTLAAIVPEAFEVRLSHRKILSTVAQSMLGANESNHLHALLIIVDKMEKIGIPAAQELIVKLGFDAASAKEFLETLSSSDHAALEKHLNAVNADWTRLQKTCNFLQLLAQKSPQASIVCDYRIARGLGYYTGIVFEIRLRDRPDFGAICSGGRYDGLVSRFGKHDLEGVGGSIGVDRLLTALLERGNTEAEKQKKIFIAIASSEDKALEVALQLAAQLRNKNMICDYDLKGAKLANQFRYADKGGFSHVIVLGEDEIKSGVFTVKELATGTEHRQITFAKLIELIGQSGVQP